MHTITHNNEIMVVLTLLQVAISKVNDNSTYPERNTNTNHLISLDIYSAFSVERCHMCAIPHHVNHRDICRDLAKVSCRVNSAVLLWRNVVAWLLRFC